MPKMQLYLPQELYAAVKDLDLPASRLLQDAVRHEVEKRALVAEAWAYVEEIESIAGAPSEDELAEAREWARRLVASSSRNRATG